MTELTFTIIERITIFFFGIFLSCAFAGIKYNKKNVLNMSLFSILCCIIIIFADFLPNPIISWRIMPLLVHIFGILFSISFLLAIYLSQYISKLFNKDNKSVYIFGSVPILYYVINYFLETATNFWSTTDPLITEFFRCLVCIVFMLFCVVYYKEYEQKLDLERKEQIINISFEQQKK